jgi:hypothetical protein
MIVIRVRYDCCAEDERDDHNEWRTIQQCLTSETELLHVEGNIV